MEIYKIVERQPPTIMCNGVERTFVQITPQDKKCRLTYIDQDVNENLNGQRFGNLNFNNTINSDRSFSFYTPNGINNYGLYSAQGRTSGAVESMALPSCQNDMRQAAAVKFHCE